MTCYTWYTFGGTGSLCNQFSFHNIEWSMNGNCMCFVYVRIFIFDHKNWDQKVAIWILCWNWEGMCVRIESRDIKQVVRRWSVLAPNWTTHLSCWGSWSLIMWYGLLSRFTISVHDCWDYEVIVFIKGKWVTHFNRAIRVYCTLI